MGVSRKFAIDNDEAMASFLRQLCADLHPPAAPQDLLPASADNTDPVEGKESAMDGSVAVEVDGVQTVEEVASSSQCSGAAHSNGTNVSSSSAPRCKRKATEKCIHNLCFQCCYDTRKHAIVLCQEVGLAAVDAATQQAAVSMCPPHYMKTVKRDREDKYIEDGLQGCKKLRPLPNLAEERFSNTFQTVVVWSTKDFVANKRWSEDTFNGLLRQERQRKLSAKRQQR